MAQTVGAMLERLLREQPDAAEVPWSGERARCEGDGRTDRPLRQLSLDGEAIAELDSLLPVLARFRALR